MLVLTRKDGEQLVIMVDTVRIAVTVLDATAGRVRLGVEAPPSIHVWRKELLDRVWGGDADDERARD